MLKVSILHREGQDRSVMVEPKIIIGTLNPIYLIRSEYRQPGKIEVKLLNLPVKCKMQSSTGLTGLIQKKIHIYNYISLLIGFKSNYTVKTYLYLTHNVTDFYSILFLFQDFILAFVIPRF